MEGLPIDFESQRDGKTDRKVRFCNTNDCRIRNECKLCENTFIKRSKARSTTVNHVKADIVCNVSKERDDMIADIGCPNSVISSKDVQSFVKNLSQFQQDNMEIIKADEKFKFGPSGPFECTEKLKFPIEVDSEMLWVEVAIVDADIPMLLGNNIFKPLGAMIKIFSSGNGILVLGDVEIPLKETKGGHYVLKVTNLGKLCQKIERDVLLVLKEHKCDQCDDSFDRKRDLSHHTIMMHSSKGYEKPALKKSIKDGKRVVKKCPHEILTDLNTFYNGSKSSREEKLVQIMMSLVQVQNKSAECVSCDDTEKISKNMNTHSDIHEQNPSLKCECIAKPFGDHCNLRIHEERVHEDNCEKCSNGQANKTQLNSHTQDEHEDDMKSILMVHHVGTTTDDDDDDVFEMNTSVWETLLTENGEKELSEEEKKEILKLHKYFAHRNGQKLWENLFQPAGLFKGKKSLILEFLGKCPICRKFRRTPSRPKVGLPKAKDANEVVSMDLKIFQKDGKKKKKEIGILYLHDEFTKLIKGQVINDKQKDTIIKGIEKKWIIGDGMGPGHPSRGFFSDNGGEFLNEDLIDFASSLNITIRMTAASSPWMNGSCERAHATVDRLVEKILEDDPKSDLQKAVDLACFVKNTEINQTGFSPMQLFTGRSPTFPGLSDCSPASVDLDGGSNEYIKVLKRMDHARVEARKIDCNLRLKTALKSKINPSLSHSYHIGQSVWFKVQTSHKWKAGIVIGQEGKVIFIKYGLL